MVFLLVLVSSFSNVLMTDLVFVTGRRVTYTIINHKTLCVPFFLFGSGVPSTTALNLFCFLERLASLMANATVGSLWNKSVNYNISSVNVYPTSSCFFFLFLVFCCFTSSIKVISIPITCILHIIYPTTVTTLTQNSSVPCPNIILASIHRNIHTTQHISF